MQKLISSGSALYPEDRRAIKQKVTPHLYEMYSSTEGGAVSVLGPQDAELYPDSVGRPCFRVQIEIVDQDDRPVPDGETGRLRYRSPASATGLSPGRQQRARSSDGWYYPGDLAALNADGFVFLKGRVKDMIIRGGVNIYPGRHRAGAAALGRGQRGRRRRHARRARSARRSARSSSRTRSADEAKLIVDLPRRACLLQGARRASSFSTACPSIRAARSSKPSCSSCYRTPRPAAPPDVAMRQGHATMDVTIRSRM